MAKKKDKTYRISGTVVEYITAKSEADAWAIFCRLLDKGLVTFVSTDMKEED